MDHSCLGRNRMEAIDVFIHLLEYHSCSTESLSEASATDFQILKQSSKPIYSYTPILLYHFEDGNNIPYSKVHYQYKERETKWKVQLAYEITFPTEWF